MMIVRAGGTFFGFFSLLLLASVFQPPEARAQFRKPVATLEAVAPPGYERPAAPSGLVPFGPCDLAVPPGALPEDGGSGDEDCGTFSNVNGGCNGLNPLLPLTLQPGDVVEGHAFTYDVMGQNARDTDWFRVDPVSMAMTLRWTVATNVGSIPGQGALNLFIIHDPNPECQATADIVAATTSVPGDCQEYFVEFLAQPGEQYYLWVGTNGFVGYECDPNDPDSNRYYGRYEVLPPMSSCAMSPVPPSTPQWIEDFDDYVLPQPENAVELFSAPENDALEGSDGTGPAPLVVNEQYAGANVPVPQSGANVLYLGGGAGDASASRRHCDAQQSDLVGQTILSRAFLYVPSGSTGNAYYIELSDYEPTGATTWAHQSHFRGDGTFDEEIHGLATGTYELDRWIEIAVEHNLDDNEQLLRLNSQPVTPPFPWTDSPVTGINLEATIYFADSHSGFFLDSLETLVSDPGGGRRGIRGDFNGNGTFEGIADGTGLLAFSFIPGSPPPPCEETADADGDGVISGLADALSILSAAFIPGAPPLPPPFPGCGDLTDLLGCDSPPGCP